MVTEALYTQAKKLVPIPDLFGLGFGVGKYLVNNDGTCSCGKDQCVHSTAVKIMKGEEIELGDTSVPNYCKNGMSRWDVVSAFHKELRRGDTDKALYWLEVMIQSKFSAFYMNNYILSIFGEELCTCDMTPMHDIRALSNLKVVDEYNLYAMVEKFSEAKKWWECKKCSDRRLVSWNNIHAEVKNDPPRELPLYVHDIHTRKGKALHAEGKADMRWSGTNLGMMWRRRVIEAGLDIKTALWRDVDMSDAKQLEYIDEVW